LRSTTVSKPRLLPTSSAIVLDTTWSWAMTILVTGSTMRTALNGVDTLFLLNAVASDEVTQALGILDLARVYVK
jgi:hypothetical protein